ncbi:hypothetical protein HK104_001308 [Borealophlyctis nickersoniae]|nr:hypothetical protein HK104_001308 [Borealophlyctis nickersoniae]
MSTQPPPPRPDRTESLSRPQRSDSLLPPPRVFPAWERWVVLSISTLGAFLASVQGSALIVALPDLMAALDATIGTIMWVMISYILVVAAISQILGKLDKKPSPDQRSIIKFQTTSGDKLGRALTYNIGFALFALGGLLAGFSDRAHKGYDLIGYRCIQGLGACLIFVSSGAIVADRFAPFGQVGFATGFIQLALAFGSVVGPVIGGGAVEASWKWVFWVTIIPAALACVAAFWKNKDVYPFSRARLMKFLGEYNLLGAFFFVTAITLLIIALQEAVFPDGSGLSTSLGKWMTGLGCVVAAALWIGTDLRAKVPVLSRELWLSKDFSIAALGLTMSSFVRSNYVFAFIFYFQGPYSLSPLMAGVYTIPYGFGLMVTGFLSGRLMDRFGPRIMCMAGPIFAGLASIGTIFHTHHTSYGAIAVNLFLVGCGWGMFNSPAMTLLLVSVKPEKRGEASSVSMTLIMIAQVLAIIFVFKFILASLSFEQAIALFLYGGGGLNEDAINSFLNGLHVVYYVSLGVSFATAALSFFMSNRPAPNVGGAKAAGEGVGSPEVVDGGDTLVDELPALAREKDVEAGNV